MKKNILFIYPNSFPISGAATNRLIGICRGLVDEGNLVEVIINRPTERRKNQLNYHRNGIYKGIHFEYATNTLIWPEKKHLKLYYFILGQIFTISRIVKKAWQKKIDIIVSVANYGFFENIILFLISRLLKVKLLYTVDEFPWVLINGEKYMYFYRLLYLKYFYKLFDGFIVMTKVLLEYYKTLARKSAQFLHVPMTVEFDRFFNLTKCSSEDYIAYCGGDRDGKKDGNEILLRAFKIVLQKFNKIKLYFIGHIDDNLVKLSNELKIGNSIKFCGFVDRDEVVRLISEAKVLCLARPFNLQAEGGFPTKLGEYLATGNPVVVTKVGEISKYLQDKVNAFLAVPGDIESFANKLIECLSNMHEAKIIGENGRKIAKELFDYRNYSRKLDLFIDSFVRK